MPADFRVLVATDGSPSARAALATAVRFPWPQPSRARAVVALGALSPRGSSAAYRAAVVRALSAHTEAARDALRSRWPEADAVALHEGPVDAILSEKRRFAAAALVLGWRGHGTFRRLLAGSVSRALVARADCPVLVARAAPQAVRRIVVGFDDCPNARRAVQFLGQLKPPRASVIWLVNVVEPLLQPPTRRLPRASASIIRSELARLTRERYEDAAAKSEAAAAGLKKQGWRVRTEVRSGAPLEGLLAAARERRADVVAVGARATSGLGRALLGSVAAGLLDRSPVPVLVVP
jgi:nucleotide-binding universal stress UspA family protein